MRRPMWTVVAAIAVIGALTIAVSASGSDRGRGKGHERTIRVDSVSVGTGFVDNAPQQGPSDPPSAGDVLILRDKLVADGKQVGTDQAVFTFTDGEGHAQGSATLILPEGHIVSLDAVDFNENPSTFAIVGGTGAYRKARGEIVVTQVNDTTSSFVIHLTH